MSRWRVIGIGGEEGKVKELGSRGYRESIPISALPYVPVSPTLTLSPLPSSSRLRLSYRSNAFGTSLCSFRSSLFGLARAISAQQAFDLRFCGERAIKKCHQDNIAMLKSVAASLRIPRAMVSALSSRSPSSAPAVLQRSPPRACSHFVD